MLVDAPNRWDQTHPTHPHADRWAFPVSPSAGQVLIVENPRAGSVVRDSGFVIRRLSSAIYIRSERVYRHGRDREIERLRHSWTDLGDQKPENESPALEALLGEKLADIDEFDRVQLAHVVQVCTDSPSLSAAGRRLFAASRSKRTVRNDADRLRKYLARFELDWSTLSDLVRSNSSTSSH